MFIYHWAKQNSLLLAINVGIWLRTRACKDASNAMPNQTLLSATTQHDKKSCKGAIHVQNVVCAKRNLFVFMNA